MSQRDLAAITPGVGLIFDDRYLYHNTGLYLINDVSSFPFPHPISHPSSPELLSRAKQLMDLAGVTDRMTHISAYEASDDALIAFHTPGYLGTVKSLAKTGGDTGEGAPIGVGGDRIARLAAGGVMAAVDAVLGREVGSAYALIRPPGHHAMPNFGKGFCIFNNVVVGVRHAQRKYGVARTMVLDWDVHHGNGTQSAFYEDTDVLFVSIHQDDLFPPGWGALGDVGEGRARGMTVNIPLPAGTGTAGYLATFDRIVLPIARTFRPELIFVSAGQDASVSDPLARMALTTSAYRQMTARMLELAAEFCDGRLIIAQEGGYAATYAPYCTAAIAETLTGPGDAVLPIEEPYGPQAETLPAINQFGLDAVRAIENVIAVQRQFWPILKTR
jgi:acetoin utilization deacetylase AcuC-like enzyme